MDESWPRAPNEESWLRDWWAVWAQEVSADGLNLALLRARKAKLHYAGSFKVVLDNKYRGTECWL